MSRIGNRKIVIPEGVSVEHEENVIKDDYDCLKNILKIFKDLDELGEELECK